MILNYSNYGTRQETINLYLHDGCPDCSLSAKQEGKCLANHRGICLIREKVVTFRMVKLNLLLSIFLITKRVTHFLFYHYMGCQRIPIIPN